MNADEGEGQGTVIWYWVGDASVTYLFQTEREMPRSYHSPMLGASDDNHQISP